MQALTLAIGQAGIDYFSQSFVSGHLVKLLTNMTIPDHQIQVGDFSDYGAGYTDSFYDININLSNGTLHNYAPSYQSVTQLASGSPSGSDFQLEFNAGAFSVSYAWNETGSETFCSSSSFGSNCSNHGVNGNYAYNPQLAGLSVQVKLSFQYDAASDSYTIVGAGETATPGAVTANIPGDSVIQNEDSSCFSSHVSTATANTLSSIDFQGAVTGAIPPLLKSIPASGDLGNGIVFDFALGDSGLGFSPQSGQNGLTIGVNGSVTWNGTPYPGPPQQALPLPPIPAASSTSHLQTYVSDYSVNGLQWAYFQAGLLSATETAGTVPDPAVLKCKTYVASIAALKPYVLYSMQADIKPLSAPVTAFQEVWEFTQAAINTLKDQVWSPEWNVLNSAMIGNSYLSQASMDSDLQAYGIDPQHFTVIGNATSGMGMVVSHDLEFVLTILNGAATQPTITFSVQRTDIQGDLVMGVAQVSGSTAQTLQFSYLNNAYAATFVSSTVPGFPDGATFADVIWPTVGEPAYDNVLQAMGKAGVPIPIMSGFSFVFADARLTVQQGYVSIEAQVQQQTSGAVVA
ncbi:hypothetical protein ACX3YG_12140 [Pseudomonas wadenswilerensis]